MKKQTYWDCMTTSDATDRKAYVKDGKQRVKLSRTVTRDCATGITEEAGDVGEAELIREEEPDGLGEEPDGPGEEPDGLGEEPDGLREEPDGLRELFREGLVAWSTGVGSYVQSKPTKK